MCSQVQKIACCLVDKAHIIDQVFLLSILKWDFWYANDEKVAPMVNFFLPGIYISFLFCKTGFWKVYTVCFFTRIVYPDPNLQICHFLVINIVVQFKKPGKEH